MAISQKTHFAQVSFTKKPTPPTFSINLSETFRINVNMDFSHTNRKNFKLKIQRKKPGFSRIFGSAFFWGFKLFLGAIIKLA